MGGALRLPGFNGKVYHGGGGAGGRIAIYFTESIFNGSITSVGGSGGFSDPGGPGTIFMKNETSGFKKLSLDNGLSLAQTAEITNMAETSGTVAWLTEANTTLFEFDEIQITGNSALAIEPTSIAESSPFVSFP